MSHRTFTLWHSLVGMSLLLIIEGALLQLMLPASAAITVILGAAIIGSITNIYITTEVIEEVRKASHMLVLLSVTAAEFIAFFAFQYWYLLLVQPGSFPSLGSDAITLLLHSTMTFVFNPLYTPATDAGRALLLINTLGALGLVLFILQNVSQFRKGK
jgi:hypothetical protein